MYKRSFGATMVGNKFDKSSKDRAFEFLKRNLPQEVVVKNAVSVSILVALIKKQLANVSNFCVVFGFISRVSIARTEMLNWIYEPNMLGYLGVVDFIQYLTKGFVSAKFKE